MRNYVLFAILGVFCIRCNESASDFPSKFEFRKSYIERFKLMFTRRLLEKGFNHSAAIREVVDLDSNRNSDPLLTKSDLHLIDSLVNAEFAPISKNSTEETATAVVIPNRDLVLLTLLEKVESRWLDELANERYRRMGDMSN